MRILVCSWGNICEPDLALSLKDMGHEVVVLKEKIENKDYDINYLRRLSDELLKLTFDCVFSINFVPIISRVCNTHHIKYLSWTVDSPLFQLNSESIKNPCNYIFIFDRSLYNRFHDKCDRIYYMPLGANVRFWDSIFLTEEDKNRFTTDVSFVGSLYEDKHNYDKVAMPNYLKGYFDGIIEAQTNIYGYNFLNDVISDKAIDEFCKCANWTGVGQDYSISKREIVITEFLGRKCAEVERTRFISKIAKNFKFDLYTLSNTDSIPHVNNRGPADSRIDMPKIFKCSKININMTIKSIETGIPLRIYDIMGNGGFVITNYQSELLEYFVPNEDLVIYESLEDLIIKISYYLQHEEERKKIAENGYKKVKELYTFEKCLEKIILTVWQDISKCYGVNSEKNKLEYKALVHLLNHVKPNTILDVGLFLNKYDGSNLANENNLIGKYTIDGVQICSFEEKEDCNIYQGKYAYHQIPLKYYDVIIMMDILKFLKKEEIASFIQQFRQFSQVLILDYELQYIEVLSDVEKFSIEKINVGECELLLITLH